MRLYSERQTEKVLFTFERKILRRIYGPTQDKGRWRPIWNNEICNLYKDLNVVTILKLEEQKQQVVL